MIDTIREELRIVIQNEAWRGKMALRKDPRRIGRLLAKNVRAKYRGGFSKHLREALKQAGYTSLTPLVIEEIDTYFLLVRERCVDAQLARVSMTDRQRPAPTPRQLGFRFTSNGIERVAG